MKIPNDYYDSVFINCPFDDEYKSLFNAMVFTVHDCGFLVRCTQEEDDSSHIRMEKIYRIISGCRYGIHDISRTELSERSNLPRFNMPLELGIFLGAKKYGTPSNRRKSVLILDKENFRYQQFISDISGQDIKAHNNEDITIIRTVRDWLASTSRRKNIPSGSIIHQHYEDFISELPDICEESNLNINELTFYDYTLTLSEWLINRDKEETEENGDDNA